MYVYIDYMILWLYYEPFMDFCRPELLLVLVAHGLKAAEGSEGNWGVKHSRNNNLKNFTQLATKKDTRTSHKYKKILLIFEKEKRT